MLEVQGLVKFYGARCVVDGVDFRVEQGEIVGLLGPNGAGKTTSFRMTCGMIEPNQGKVVLNNLDVTRWPMYRRAREGGMGYLAQESSVFRKLTVEKNLLGVMELLGMDRKTRYARCDELLDQFDIKRLRKAVALSLSGGERRRLEIARALVSNPKIILLDEPFTGIDPVTIASIQKIIRGLKDNGIAILITDHQVRETLQITDRSYVIRAGKVLCHGPPDEVLNHPEAREYYFGENMDLGHRSPPSPYQPPGQPRRIDGHGDDADMATSGAQSILHSVVRDMSIYVDLTREFNAPGLNAILSSGQAVVLHRLAIMSKDGDWILREHEAALEHVLAVLAAREAVYRFGAPLDLRWMRGGWSAHLEFRHGPMRIRTDFVTRPPRLAPEELDELWRRQEGCDLPFVDARNLIELKKTNREKDYAVIGELARLLTDPEEQLLTSRSARDILDMASRHPGLAASLAEQRPALAAVAGWDRRPGNRPRCRTTRHDSRQ